MRDAWIGGSIGTVTLDEVHQALRDRLGLDEEQVTAFMADMWREYLGTANTELIEYARGLRPRYRTGILSNSFVGAREREQEAYGFEDLVDEIVYSHECGMSKPDPRIYALTCERLGVLPEETVFVDDYAPNVVAAREAALHGVHHTVNLTTIGGIERLLRKARAAGLLNGPSRQRTAGRWPSRTPGTVRLPVLWKKTAARCCSHLP